MFMNEEIITIRKPTNTKEKLVFYLLQTNKINTIILVSPNDAIKTIIH